MNAEFIELMEVLNRINPPESLQSFEEMEEAINSNLRYSLVQRQFYLKLMDAFYRLKKSGVPGDIAVAGVWKGGSAIFMQALLRFFKIEKRIFLFDTFSTFGEHGIYTPKEQNFVTLLNSKVATAEKYYTEADVSKHFELFGLGTDNLIFCKGPVEQTVVAQSQNTFCLLHTDVDFYTPTYAFLNALYPSLQSGGYVFADDYGAAVYDCRQAVDEVRTKYGAEGILFKLTDYIFYWIKE